MLSCAFCFADTSSDTGDLNSKKDAYVTILHSGADYVCGAIATAHSIRKTSSTKDLVILVDSSISPEHRQALQEAGWKVRDLERIYKSSTVGGKQQEKDFSRFRLWQLTDYSKVTFSSLSLVFFLTCGVCELRSAVILRLNPFYSYRMPPYLLYQCANVSGCTVN